MPIGGGSACVAQAVRDGDWIRRSVILALFAFALTFSDFALAQVAIPGTAQPGRVEEPVERPPAAPQGEATVEEQETQRPTPMESGLKFVLREVTIENATVISDDEFLSVYERYLGTEIAAETVFEIAAEATALYRKKGYIISQVIVPPQEVDGGAIRLQAVEGFVDQVIVEGDVGRGRLVEATVAKIAHHRPLNTRQLERYLLLAGDLAGVRVRGVFSPSETTTGAATLTVVSEYDPLEGVVAVSNDGSDFVGPVLGSGEVIMNSWLGLNERIGLRVAGTPELEELRFGEIYWSLPFTTEGTTFNGRASRSEAEPGENLSAIGFESTANRYSVDITHPFIRSRKKNLFGTVQFDWDDLDGDTRARPNSRDKLRILRVRATGDKVDTLFGSSKPGVSSARVSFNWGLDAFDSTQINDPIPSRTNADADFFSLQIDAERLQKLTTHWTAYVAASAQYTAERLLASELIGFGGRTFGRGFDPSAITGDTGFLAKGELQYQNTTGIRFIDQYQLYGFYDYGHVENINAAANNQPGHQDLQSAGGGIRLDMAGGRLKADFTLAVRLEDGQHADNISDKLSGYFRIVKEF